MRLENILGSKLVSKIISKLKLAFLEKWYHLVFTPPCYLISDTLHNNSIVVDCGTGNDADFSQALIKNYGLKVYGFEPTKKHFNALNKLVKEYHDKFTYFSYALSIDSGSKIFFESQENISGSFSSDHENIKNDDCVEYNVKTIDIPGIFQLIGEPHIDLLKLDVEGEEYSLLLNLDKKILKKIDQIVIEFHHFCIDRYSWDNTQEVIEWLKQAGFMSHTRDNRNYLFWR